MIQTKIEKILNLYLEYKCRLKPIDTEDTVIWEREECLQCGNIAYILKVNEFAPGIQITEGELLDFVIKHKIYFEEDNIHYNS